MSNLTIRGVVDLVRECLREVSDDSVYSDKFIYRILLEARAELLNQMYEKNNSFSPWLYQRFCLKLCPSSFIECGCAPFDFACNVYRSTEPLPQPIGGDTLVLNISELWGDKINRLTENQFRTLSTRKYKVPYYYYIGHYNNDHYLFILGNSTAPPKYIKAEGVFEDPSEVLRFACTDEECPSLYGTGFPFQLSKESTLIKMAIEMILVSKKLPEDLSNNSQSTTNETII
jgi:hypothetical protein